MPTSTAVALAYFTVSGAVFLSFFGVFIWRTARDETRDLGLDGWLDGLDGPHGMLPVTGAILRLIWPLALFGTVVALPARVARKRAIDNAAERRDMAERLDTAALLFPGQSGERATLADAAHELRQTTR